MSKSNVEIISEEASKKNYNYTGDNLFTFKEWQDLGYAIVRGQKAFIKTRLWSHGINKRMKPECLFRVDQVVRVNSNEMVMV